MARFVRLASAADEARTALPVQARRAVSAAIVRIAENPAWETSAPDLRLLSPGSSPNTGLIAVPVQVGRDLYVIVYRAKLVDETIWIEDIRHVVVG